MTSAQTRHQTTIATYVKLILTALFWGGTWVCGRVAVQEASPFMIASWRFLLATGALGLLLIARQGWPRWNLRQWLFLSGLGASGVFFYNIFFLFGLQRVEAGRGALVVALSPVFIALIDTLVFKAKLTLIKLAGISLALIGSLMVVTNGQLGHFLTGEAGFGECLLIGSVLSWVTYTYIVRACQAELSSLEMAFGGCFTGWLMVTALALYGGTLFAFDQLTWRGISSILFLGIFGSAIAFMWYSDGISRIGTTMTAAFINLVPVFAVLLGMLLLGERLGTATLAGGACVITGVILTNRKKTAPSLPLEKPEP